jgi:hypothetical protein
MPMLGWFRQKGLSPFTGSTAKKPNHIEIATGHGTQEKQKADWYIPIGALLIAFD